jgi:hypothetical protein
MKRLYMMTMTRETVDMHVRNKRDMNKISANVCMHNSVLEQRRRRVSSWVCLHLRVEVIWAADYYHVQRTSGQSACGLFVFIKDGALKQGYAPELRMEGVHFFTVETLGPCTAAPPVRDTDHHY